MNRSKSTPRSKRNALVFGVALLMLSACSSGSIDDQDSQGLDGNQPATAQTDANAPAKATDAVPDDGNPELALAVAAGAVIVADDTPQNPAQPAGDQTTAQNSQPAPLDNNSPAPASTAAAVPEPIVDTAAVDNNTAAVTTPSAPVADTAAVQTPVDTTTPVATSSAPADTAVAQGGSDQADYQVKKGDTLMKIAYEQYGDIYRWREIYASNKGSIQDPNHVPPGTVIKLETLGGGRKPGSVAIDHNGEQYLIQSGDTLGTISSSVYGTKEKWKAIFENNRQLIKDPNKIYAGFYLYYVPENKVTMN